MTADDVRARFEAWVATRAPHVRKEPIVEVAFDAGYRAAHADRDAEVRELVEADRLLDKCDAALESHRDAKVYDEAWGATQLELHRTRDLAVRRRAAALAKVTQEKP